VERAGSWSLAVLGAGVFDPQVGVHGVDANPLGSARRARVRDDAPVGETPVTVELESERTGSGSKRRIRPATHYISVHHERSSGLLVHRELTLSGEYDSKYEFDESTLPLVPRIEGDNGGL